jgi:septal ring factor EnvC (AmiA/AmiB activator)
MAALVLSILPSLAQTTDPSKLENLQKEIDQTLERRRALEKEAVATREEAEKVQKELVSTAARVQARETDVTFSEERLEGLEAADAVLRARLLSRRGKLAQLLAALARLDRNPPPALAVKPDDALGAIRSALLLAASVPELRGEAERLKVRLDDLTRLRERITAEHAALGLAKASLEREKASLESMLAEKRKREQLLASQADSEQAKAQRLSAQAKDLADLIARLEAQAAERLPVSRPEQKPQEESTSVTATLPRPSAMAGSEGAEPESQQGTSQTEQQMAALIPPRSLPSSGSGRLFSRATGLIPLPVRGALTRSFGADDGLGGTQQGISITTRENAAVTAPFDGKVLFAGPFRRYGQLLIISVGEGYHVLLAGMARIDAVAGQNILAGEPVGIMGSTAAANAETGQGGRQSGKPLLYMELRKNGAAIDPRPWLVVSDRKARS